MAATKLTAEGRGAYYLFAASWPGVGRAAYCKTHCGGAERERVPATRSYPVSTYYVVQTPTDPYKKIVEQSRAQGNRRYPPNNLISTTTTLSQKRKTRRKRERERERKKEER